MKRLTILGIALASLSVGSVAFAQSPATNEKPYTFDQPVQSNTGNKPYSFSQPYIGGGGSAQPNQYQGANNPNNPSDNPAPQKQ